MTYGRRGSALRAVAGAMGPDTRVAVEHTGHQMLCASEGCGGGCRTYRDGEQRDRSFGCGPLTPETILRCRQRPAPSLAAWV